METCQHKSWCDIAPGNIYGSNTECNCGLELAKQEMTNLEDFVNSFLFPERNGYAVSPFIRDEARYLLGIKPCETV